MPLSNSSILHCLLLGKLALKAQLLPQHYLLYATAAISHCVFGRVVYNSVSVGQNMIFQSHIKYLLEYCMLVSKFHS